MTRDEERQMEAWQAQARAEAVEKRERAAFELGRQSILARLENPDEAMVEAVFGAMPVQVEYWQNGAIIHAEVLDRTSPKFVTPESVIRALARTLTEGQEGESNDG